MEETTQPIPVTSVRKETREERFQRLKWLSDVTGKRYVQVYLEDEKKRQRDHR